MESGATVDLDALRGLGDPDADAVAAAYFADDPDPRRHAGFFRAATGSAAAAQHPAVASWLAEQPVLPAWADPARMASGAAFFAEWGLELGVALFTCALPLGYAAGPSAHVLDLTARLETDARRRVFETAQLVLDVTAPGGLNPGGQGLATIRRVRLVHAGIRHLVATDPRIERVTNPSPEAHAWAPEWGTPVSQEHLLGALLAFGGCLLDSLDLLEIGYDHQAGEDYLHLWSVVGHLLGIEPAMLPIDRARTDVLEPRLRARNLAATAAGQRLAAALLDLLEGLCPLPGVRALPAATLRLLCGDAVADALGVPVHDRAAHAFERALPLIRLASKPAERSTGAHVARWLGRTIMTGFVTAERPGGRPAFAIPDHLAAAWDVP